MFPRPAVRSSGCVTLARRSVVQRDDRPTSRRRVKRLTRARRGDALASAAEQTCVEALAWTWIHARCERDAGSREAVSCTPGECHVGSAESPRASLVNAGAAEKCPEAAANSMGAAAAAAARRGNEADATIAALAEQLRLHSGPAATVLGQCSIAKRVTAGEPGCAAARTGQRPRWSREERARPRTAPVPSAQSLEGAGRSGGSGKGGAAAPPAVGRTAEYRGLRRSSADLGASGAGGPRGARCQTCRRRVTSTRSRRCGRRISSRKNQIEHIKTEREVMASCGAPVRRPAVLFVRLGRQPVR